MKKVSHKKIGQRNQPEESTILHRVSNLLPVTAAHRGEEAAQAGKAEHRLEVAVSKYVCGLIAASGRTG